MHSLEFSINSILPLFFSFECMNNEYGRRCSYIYIHTELKCEMKLFSRKIDLSLSTRRNNNSNRKKKWTKFSCVEVKQGNSNILVYICLCSRRCCEQRKKQKRNNNLKLTSTLVNPVYEWAQPWESVELKFDSNVFFFVASFLHINVYICVYMCLLWFYST